MADRPTEPTESAYVKFRRSRAFSIAFLSFVAMWLTLNALWHFDASKESINMILSIEAGLSLAIQSRDAALHEKFIAKLLGYVADNTEAIRELLLSFVDGASHMKSGIAAILELLRKPNEH